jgi:hypothetical protein
LYVYDKPNTQTSGLSPWIQNEILNKYKGIFEKLGCAVAQVVSCQLLSMTVCVEFLVDRFSPHIYY